MIINKKLNLVIPIERDDGSRIYIHSAPISREVFEMYFRVMARAFADIQKLGMAVALGPKLAEISLRQIAKESGQWDGDDGVERGLMGEIRRLSNVIVPGPNGWRAMPLTDAIGDKLIEPEDIEEAEGAIVFFILSSAMSPKSVLAINLQATTEWWGSQITSSNCTEFARSLPTLTATGNSGATATRSSIPS